jgi:hypothetical protein
MLRIIRGPRRHVLVAFTLVLPVFLAAEAGAQSAPCSFRLGYPGDSAAPPSIAAWLAGRATAAGLPPELPVMASLIESGLQNIAGGDADSVGFFQMRVGIWNKGVYLGYPDQPELQVKWFLDQAAAVRNSAFLHGNRAYVESAAGYGRWIDDALRPGGNSRKSYQAALARARALIDEGRSAAGSWPFIGSAPGQDAPAADIAAWMATRAVAAGLPGELPIMAALVESGLRNLPSDGDVAGYFRIPERIWDTGGYAGFANQPELQIKWFIDQAHAAAVDRITAGDAFFGQDSSQFGEWIADVERPAAHLRGRYQLQLETARLLMQVGCRTTR